MMKNVKTVLIIKLRDIGDLVLSTPVINIIDYNYSSPTIIYVVKKEYENFKYLFPHVTRVITYDKNDPFDFIRVILKLKQYKFDLAVNLHASFRSALITYFSGAKLRLIHNHSGKDFFTSIPLGIIETQKSIIERDIDTLKPLKLDPISAEMKKTKLQLNEEYVRYIGDEDFSMTIGFGIGAKRTNKIWPKEKFIETGKKLADDGYNIAVFCSKNEKEWGEEIVRSIGIKSKLYCNLDFLRLGFFLNKLRLFIGNDSGPRHIAAALGVKTITLFGPENPVEWHPYKTEDGHIKISHLDEFVKEGINVNMNKFREKSMDPINRIKVDEVYEASKKLLTKSLKET
jgi:ADP-heptose:LPS heptosyltransferase